MYNYNKFSYPGETDYGASEPPVSFVVPGSGGTTVIYVPTEGSGNSGANVPSTDNYTLNLLQTPTSGYLTSYQLKKNGTPVGDVINIPKDLFLSSAELKTVIKKNEPVQGWNVGDKYIDLAANTVDGNGELEIQHVYLAVNDLVDTYFVGNGLEGYNRTFSLKINGSAANGLSVNADGLRLNAANSSTTGALTSTDYTKFAGYEDAIKAVVSWIKTLNSTTEVPAALSSFNVA